MRDACHRVGSWPRFLRLRSTRMSSMTIAIAASGSRAGAAVRDAVLGAELLGRGAIGGFAVLALLSGDGQLHHCMTQRGGASCLDMPDAWLAAPTAAAISSGPDRPEPLVQFLPGAAGIGLVTGHRHPSRPGGDGAALNAAVLALLGQGAAPQPAVASGLAANAEADAGLIAIDAQGVLGWGNSERVLRRSDLGQFQRDDGSARVAILHNSIFSCAPLAEQVGALAWAQLTGFAGPIGWVRLAAAVPRRIAHRDRVHIDPSGAITAIDSANPYVPTNLHRTTVAYLGSEVWRHGVCVGRVMTELVADVADGMVMPFGDAAHDAFLMRTDHVAS